MPAASRQQSLVHKSTIAATSRSQAIHVIIYRHLSCESKTKVYVGFAHCFLCVCFNTQTNVASQLRFTVIQSSSFFFLIVLFWTVENGYCICYLMLIQHCVDDWHDWHIWPGNLCHDRCLLLAMLCSQSDENDLIPDKNVLEENHSDTNCPWMFCDLRMHILLCKW